MIAVQCVINTLLVRDCAGHLHGNAFICWSGTDNIDLDCAWGSDSGVEVVVEVVPDGAFSLVTTEGFCSS